MTGDCEAKGAAAAGRRGRSRRRAGLTAGVIVAVLVAVAGVGLAGVTLAGRVRVLSIGPGSDQVQAITGSGGDVWFASMRADGYGSVTEVAGRTGERIRTLSGRGYGFRYPAAIVATGAAIWVANDPQDGDGRAPRVGDGNLTELDARTGQRIGTISGRRYGFDFPCALAVAGSHLWVVNCLGTTLTELVASDGRFIRTVPAGGPAKSSSPTAIAVTSGHLWVANSGGRYGWVSELSASTGRVIRTLSGSEYGFNGPTAITAAGGHIWIANLYPAGNGGSVTELNASNGSLVKVLSGGCYGFDSPAGISAIGNQVWVANSNIDQTGGSVTELNASTGRWIATVAGTSWPYTLLRTGCLSDILTAGWYHFSNPSVIAAVGGHILVGSNDGAIVLSG